MTRKLLLTVFAVALVAGSGPAEADAQAAIQATISDVVDGDTVTARLNDNRELTVKLIGVDAPQPTECGGDDARDTLERLVKDHAVTLQRDPALATTDEQGRQMYYVDRDDGLDLGIEMVRRGLATVIESPVYQRLQDYLDAEDATEAGIWAHCDGDFHLTPAEQRRAQRASAKAFVHRYYRRLSSKRFASAWSMLGGPVKRKLGNSFRGWRAGFRHSHGVTVPAARAWNSGRRVVVRVRLRSRDRDVCSGRVVAQSFKGNLLLAPRNGSWRIVRFRIRKTGGATPRLSKSDCPPPKPSPAPTGPAPDCQGYDPCLPPGPDVDCAGGSGDGPRYIESPVNVGGSDPYDLDRDGDGVACES